MQMGYDFENSLLAAEASAGSRGRFGEPAGALPDGGVLAHDPGAAPAAAEDRPALRPLDWAGLRARFAAIHALRHALAQNPAAAAASGSFAEAGESVLSTCHNGTPVNPVYWVNSKGPCAITESVAAAPHAATED